MRTHKRTSLLLLFLLDNKTVAVAAECEILAGKKQPGKRPKGASLTKAYFLLWPSVRATAGDFREHSRLGLSLVRVF
jgi:hypothetical protein